MTSDTNPGPQFDERFGPPLQSQGISPETNVKGLDERIGELVNSLTVSKQQFVKTADNATNKMTALKEGMLVEQKELMTCYFRRACLTTSEGQAFGKGFRTEKMSVFYTGSSVTPEEGKTTLKPKDVAAEYADRNNGCTIEQVSGGNWLDKQRLFGPDSCLTNSQARALWSWASAEFAREAEGQCAVMVGPDPYDKSITATVEMPICKERGIVMNAVLYDNKIDDSQGEILGLQYCSKQGYPDLSKPSTPRGPKELETREKLMRVFLEDGDFFNYNKSSPKKGQGPIGHGY